MRNKINTERKIWDEGGQRVSSGKRGSGVVLLVKPMK